MKITIPEYALVLLIGPTGAGKSTFAKKHFLAGEIVSSDECRRMVGNDENRLDVSDDAFELLYFIIQKRLDRALLTVVDATNVYPEDRKKLIEIAKRNHVFSVAIVLNTPPTVCIERNRERPERAHLSPGVALKHSKILRQNLRGLQKEGFRYVFHLKTPDEVATAELIREPLFFNKKHEHGPFDIIGDVHGCFDELLELLQKLGWSVEKNATTGRFSTAHPDGRKAIFVGDYTDRGPNSPEVLRLVMDMAAAGTAFCLPGNHDAKLIKYLDGRDVQLTHGLQLTAGQFAPLADDFKKEVRDFLDGLVSHLIFDDGKLVVSHAGLKEKYIGRTSGKVREFCLFGDTTGETDEFGLPVRLNWAADYRGAATIVYGHTPTPEAEWLNNTICVDTGCVFGGKLTALRYPERRLVSVAARQEYYKPSRPLQKPSAPTSLQNQHDDLLDAQDLLDKKHLETRLFGNIKIRPGEAAAAFETLCRFAVNPKWLIYLPPTMSPAETSELPGLLEHPAQAFEYFQKNGVQTVVCQEKHMGSRAILVVCRDAETAARRFGILDAGEAAGTCFTRTGRRFFNDETTENQFLTAVRRALDKSGFWEKMQTDWVCLDCELMPWSAKAQALLEKQYAAVGSSSALSLAAAVGILEKTAARLPDSEAPALLENFRERLRCAHLFSKSYQNYCWPVESLADLKLAPFHILAVEGRTFFDKNHHWHLDEIEVIAAADEAGIFQKTRSLTVETNDAASVQSAIEWWENLTDSGGEGMVVKPLEFVIRSENGLVQPAIKIRGREYLRIIYGPEYSLPEHLERLRSRGLSKKRRLALQEFALGAESLTRFVEREPLRRLHEGVFGVLALESDGGDPRL